MLLLCFNPRSLSLLVLLMLSIETTNGLFFFSKHHGCPQVDPVDEADGFTIEEYIRKTWYIQRQQVNSYQPAEDLFCVTATYEMEGKKQWFTEAITVNNRASTGQINNPNSASADEQILCATRPYAKKHPALLRVAPCFLPTIFSGDYWIVAIAPDYSWSIITGGQPHVKGQCSDDKHDATLCTTPEKGFTPNGQGLWFFSREPIANATSLAQMEEAAANLGICTANLVAVVQEGCTYDNAPIK